jgi:alkanesulfonate monooxygenase SsuD/methylene tetrahydromethanopterin reductase-like flavin-dependent oxidoreductase (luciferase family)
LAKPYATICVSALLADTEEEAWMQFQSRARWRCDRDRGRFGPLLSPEEAMMDLSAEDKARMESMRTTALVGAPDQASEKLRALASSLELDELVVCAWTHDPAVQLRSFELLARAFDLPAMK